MMTLTQLAVRRASYCGNCGKPLAGAGVFYIRQQPARLICQECRDREAQGKCQEKP